MTPRTTGKRPIELVDRECAILDGKCDCKLIDECKYLRARCVESTGIGEATSPI